MIDSILVWMCGSEQRGREIAKGRDRRDELTGDFEEPCPQIALEVPVLRPLDRAPTTWWPGDGTPCAGCFARRASAHTVGYPALLDLRFAVVAWRSW